MTALHIRSLESGVREIKVDDHELFNVLFYLSQFWLRKMSFNITIGLYYHEDWRFKRK